MWVVSGPGYTLNHFFCHCSLILSLFNVYIFEGSFCFLFVWLVGFFLSLYFSPNIMFCFFQYELFTVFFFNFHNTIFLNFWNSPSTVDVKYCNCYIFLRPKAGPSFKIVPHVYFVLKLQTDLHRFQVTFLSYPNLFHFWNVMCLNQSLVFPGFHCIFPNSFHSYSYFHILFLVLVHFSHNVILPFLLFICFHSRFLTLTILFAVWHSKC